MDKLIDQNKRYAQQNKNFLEHHCKHQHPKIAVLTCSDSRVIPEYIFNQSIGEMFVVRVAGNVALDSTIITSLEYAVSKLNVELLLILGHTNCGAVHESEKCCDKKISLFNEIRQSFSLDDDHILCNLLYQMKMLPKRSFIIDKAIKCNSLQLVGAIYNLENGLVQFI